MERPFERDAHAELIEALLPREAPPPPVARYPAESRAEGAVLSLGDALAHTGAPARLLAEVASRLAASARLLLEVESARHWSRLLPLLTDERTRSASTVRSYTRAEALRLLRDAGLTATRVVPVTLAGDASRALPAALAGAGLFAGGLADEIDEVRVQILAERLPARLDAVDARSFADAAALDERIRAGRARLVGLVRGAAPKEALEALAAALEADADAWLAAPRGLALEDAPALILRRETWELLGGRDPSIDTAEGLARDALVRAASRGLAVARVDIARCERLGPARPEGREAEVLAPRRAHAPDLAPPRTGTRLALCVITKDEEASIERCLASARDVVDEIVVIDTGSRDRTVEIAERLGARVFRERWTDDFGRARNRALARVRADWVLVLDADEHLLPGAKARIRKVVRDERAAGAVLGLRNRLDGGRTSELLVARLFRAHPEIGFLNAIHEQVLPSLVRFAERRGLSVRRVDEAVILHHGYLTEAYRSREKHLRNQRLFERQLSASPDDAYSWWKYGEHLFKHGEAAASRAPMERALALIAARPDKGRGLPFAAPLCALLAMAHEEADDLAQADEVARYGHAHLTSNPDLLVMAGRALQRVGDLEPAEAAFRRALEAKPGATEAGAWPGSTSYRPMAGLADVALARGDAKQALRWAEKAVKERPTFEDGLLAKARALELLHGFERARAFVDETVRALPDARKVWRLGASLCCREERFSDALLYLGMAHRLDPEHAPTRRDLALTALGAGQPELALTVLRAGQADPVCALGIAVLCLAVGDPIDVEIELEPAVATPWIGRFLERLARGKQAALLEGFGQALPALDRMLPGVRALWSSAMGRLRRVEAA